jgi:hypothetical protein
VLDVDERSEDQWLLVLLHRRLSAGNS